MSTQLDEIMPASRADLKRLENKLQRTQTALTITIIALMILMLRMVS